MAEQQNLFKGNKITQLTVNDYSTKNQHTRRETPQSKSEVLQTRVEGRVADKIKAVCFDNGISVSDFLRLSAEIGQIYASFADVLLQDQETIIPLLKRLSKKI